MIQFAMGALKLGRWVPGDLALKVVEGMLAGIGLCSSPASWPRRPASTPPPPVLPRQDHRAAGSRRRRRAEQQRGARLKLALGAGTVAVMVLWKRPAGARCGPCRARSPRSAWPRRSRRSSTRRWRPSR
ncbi:hypothetical protein LV779_10440 [Streptomyces thinghirensis]|nr:hypothetical protein [Streptomyces thinghirensis]